VTDLKLMLAWLAGDDAKGAARRLVRRYSLRREAEDLVSETRITLINRVSRRLSPIVLVSDSTQPSVSGNTVVNWCG